MSLLNNCINLTGASGRAYRYMAAEGQLPPGGGNFALVRALDGGGWVLEALGETDSLFADGPNLKARVGGGRSLKVFMRLNISGQVRREELDDLRGAYGDVEVPA